mgnify:CR=1 FL=1
MFIDQLEMLEVKTRGNLGKEEEQLLKQSLVGTRMAFIASIEQQEKAASPAAAPAPVAEASAAAAANDAAADDESRKKFSKKY